MVAGPSEITVIADDNNSGFNNGNIFIGFRLG